MLIAALAATTGAMGGSADDGRPVRLVAEPLAQGVRFKVLGSSKEPYEVTFSLEVLSGGNQSRHRGTATLAGGELVTLSTVTVRSPPPGAWRAVLRVEPSRGKSYEEVKAYP